MKIVQQYIVRMLLPLIGASLLVIASNVVAAEGGHK